MVLKARYFWLMSDNKTVREIDYVKMRELDNANYKSKRKNYKLCDVHNNGDVFFRTAKSFIWVPNRQLDKVVEARK